MVSFARARTKSWISRLWPMPMPMPMSFHSFRSNTIQQDEENELIEKQSRHNKRFLELSENGGMWFS